MNASRRQHWAILCLAAAACAPGCVQRELAATLGDHVRVPERPVLLIFCDGVHKATFDRLLDAGRLPNIDRYLVRRGVRVRRATTILPSITYAVTATYLTGRLPGGHGIVGNAFFDREQLIYRDYTQVPTYRLVEPDCRASTLHEMLAPEFTASILLPNARGADRNFANWASAGVPWFFRQFEWIDFLSALRIEELAGEANRVGRWPDLLVDYYVAADEVGHLYGSDSEAYERILANHDIQVGRVMRFLEHNDLLDRCTIVWTTDHGHHPCRHSIAADILLRDELGIACTTGRCDEWTHSYVQRVQRFGRHRCVVVPDGKRKLSMHVRVGARWADRPTYEQVQAFAGPEQRLSERLLGHPSVDTVVLRDGPNAVHVFGRAGHGRVERVAEAGGARYVYRVLDGADPLGYASHDPAAALTDGRAHTGLEWRRATYETERPDFVGQIVEMFDHHRAGDLVAFAADGWHFDNRKKGSHGGITADEMRVPLLFAGPGLPAGAEIDTARTVDVAPTILSLMGEADRSPRCGPFDGRDLAPALRAARKSP